jgi:hypothetical protein
MTQAELELVARGIRDKGLHSSWTELLAFSDDVVGNLVDVYRTLLRNAVISGKISSSDTTEVQNVVRDKLVTVLTVLTSEAQVARWESEAFTENSSTVAQEMEDSSFERKHLQVQQEQ